MSVPANVTPTPTPTPTTTPTSAPAIPVPTIPSLSLPDDVLEDIPVDIRKALESYQVVFDILSLREISNGYSVYCRDWTFEEYTKMILKGIYAALIGDFKVGKTFVTGKLLDLPTPADQVLQTPGICIATKSFANRPTKAAEKPAQGGRGFRKQPLAKTAQGGSSSVVNNNVREFDFIFLDTAGTDMPTSMYALKDTRATEVLLRTLILNVSERVVFVTNKFDRPTQEKLVNLIKQLRKSRKEVSSQRRVLVVHNLISVTSKEVLDEKIAVVERCYTTEVDPTIEKLEDEEATIPTSVPWIVRDFSGAPVYDTSLVSHFFLVNDNAPVKDNFNPQDYNARVIKALRSKLYETDPVQQPMLQNLLKVATQQLHYFLQGWSQQHHLVPENSPDNKYHGGLIPCLLPEDENTDGQPLPSDFFLYKEWKEKLEPVVTYPWPLTRMKFVDSGVMSETVQELQGTWFVDKQNRKFLVYIRAPGFSAAKRNNQNIKFTWERTDNWVEIHVRLDKPTPIISGFEVPGVAPLIRDARGVYRCTFPENERYLLPTNTKFYEEDIKVQDGEIWITLGIEVDILGEV